MDNGWEWCGMVGIVDNGCKLELFLLFVADNSLDTYESNASGVWSDIYRTKQKSLQFGAFTIFILVYG